MNKKSLKEKKGFQTTYKENMKTDYIQACKQVEYFRVIFILDSKEIDILVPNAGGFYNF